MERWLIYTLQSLTSRHKPLQTGTVWMARAGFWAYILYGLVQWFRPGRDGVQLKRRRGLMEALLAVAVSSLISFVISLLWKRPRPFADNSVQACVAHKANASFPSNHTMNAFAAAWAVFHHSRLAGISLGIWSILIGLSRVACGLHYVTDVLGGMVIGALAGRWVRHQFLLRLVSFLVPALWQKAVKK